MADSSGKEISVIIPVYNGENYIAQSIRNVCEALSYNRELSGDEYEVIVINDGSKDRTQDIVNELLKEYSELVLINGKDEGVSVSRNLGIEKSVGRYISFVDADDLVKRDMFYQLLKYAKRGNADITGCEFECFEDYARVETKTCLDVEPSAIDFKGSEYPAKRILNGNSRVWSKLFLRSTIGDVRFRKGLTIGEDMLFLTEVSFNSDVIAEISYKGYCYYQNPKGAMKRAFTEKKMDQIYCWKELKEMLSKKSESEEVLELASSRVIINTLLVASDIAILDKTKRRQYADCVENCRDEIKRQLLEYPGSFKRLDTGYKVKCMIFRASPKAYMGLYNKWKR